MRPLPCLFLLTLVACASQSPPRTASRLEEPKPAPTSTYRNPSQEANDRYQTQALAWLGDRKNQPASQIFTNIQIEWLKGIPAENLLDIMNWGYSRALGVSCTHCHVTEDYASDEKRPKRAAREMAVMHHGVNEQLRQMQNLASPAAKRSIICFTCHRGAINPNQANQ
jgi:hypothetical protein